jgi:glycosyltransferase involved in cell wall biosynthesis
MTNKKVLFVTHYSGMYGANKSMLALIVILRNDFNINPIVLLRHNGPICNEFDRLKIQYKISHFYWWVNDNAGFYQFVLNLRKQFLNIFTVRSITNEIQNFGIQLVYSNSITLNVGSLLARQLGVPHVWHIREGLESYGFKFSLGESLSRSFFKKGADKYILISNYLYKSYENYIPVELTRMIYNGITIHHLEREINAPIEGVFNLCVVGLVAEQKNQMDALIALKILVDKGYKNIRLHIIGEHTLTYSEHILAYIKESDLDNYVELWGHRDDVINILKNMNLGLMTSHGEAFGRVTIEYMLKRIPVIASDSGANSEIIINKFNGLFYELFNTQDLAEKIEYFLNNPNQLDLIGSSAQKYASENFSAEQNAQKVYEVFSEIMENENPY